MKKSVIALSLMMALSLFTFVGCGNNDGNNDMTDNGTVTEQTDNNGGIVDETEKGINDMGNAVEDGVDDMADGARDMVDGNDNNTTKSTTNNNANNKAVNQ